MPIPVDLKIDDVSKQRKSGWRKSDSLETRLLSYVSKNGPIHPIYGQCWIWTGKIDFYGYGVLFYRYKEIKAHRASWKVHNGDLPDDIDVLHRCDNPPCTNPLHLFIGTQAVNGADMVSKDRQSRGERRYNHKLTDDMVREIRRRYRRWSKVRTNCVQLANEFGVSRELIICVVNGERWKHIKDDTDDIFSEPNG